MRESNLPLFVQCHFFRFGWSVMYTTCAGPTGPTGPTGQLLRTGRSPYPSSSKGLHDCEAVTDDRRVVFFLHWNGTMGTGNTSKPHETELKLART